MASLVTTWPDNSAPAAKTRPLTPEQDKAPTEPATQAAPESSAQSKGTHTHFRTCTLCEAMCGLKIEYQGKRIVSVAGDPEDPLSEGYICPKGYAIQDIHNDPERLKTPIKREGDQWRAISWEAAFDEVARRLADIQARYGNHSVGAYWGNPTSHNTGILLTLSRFRKALGTQNLFSASSLDQMPHQLISYLMYGHSQLFTIPDIDRTDYMLMLGANPAASNGSLMSAGNIRKRLKGISQRGGKLVLVDPRLSETAHYATEHHFIQPGTDALFLLGLIQVITDKGLTKPGRLQGLTKGWDELKTALPHWPLERIAEITGIPKDAIAQTAIDFASAESAVCYGRMGVSTQAFGALNHWLIQILNIITGNLDRPGGMMFTTPAIDLLRSGGRGGFNRYQTRVRKLPEFSREFPASAIAEEMLEPGEGQIKAFISVAGNPVISAPNGEQMDKALQQLDFMVAIDFYQNETTRHADIILPPTGPLEHEHYDLIFNILAVRNQAKYSPPLFKPGRDARSDWDIFTELSRRLEQHKRAKLSLSKRFKLALNSWLQDRIILERMLDTGLRSGPYGKASQAESSKQQPLTLAKLKQHPHGLDLGALQSCLPERLFTKDKKIQLVPPEVLPDLQRLKQTLEHHHDKDQLLLIGRRDLRTNNSWMHNSHRLVKGKDRCNLFMHPDDAAKHGIADNSKVKLTSTRGELEVPVTITDAIKRGVVSLPHGWGHHRSGMRISTAQAHAGVSMNDVTDERVLDVLSGNAVLNGVPVVVKGVG